MPRSPSRALMVQGTTSDAGKSTLVAAICRVLARHKVRVAPFKPQNMALNSAVTKDGGEIGRAQALQAQACKINAHTDMNPVLIKPSSDTGAQIIVQGKVLGNMTASNYHDYKPRASEAVFESFARLQHNYDAVIVEGAGSPAEINLREGDIANMGFAEHVDCPVILIADIDKGGVFAHLVGTLDLLSPSEQARIKGFVINKFRGDITLLQPGLDWLEQRTRRPVLGVLPYLHDFYIDAEDAIDEQQETNNEGNPFNVVVPVFPRISNHTDLDPLRLHPNVNLTFVSLKEEPPACDLIILPGSKNVRADFALLQQGPWRKAIDRHLRYGGKVLGLCGGFQMLGQAIDDPLAIEGPTGSTEALGLLPLKTTLAADKTLQQKQGLLSLNGNSAEAAGYEIHHGISVIDSALKPCIEYSDGSKDGYLSDDGQVFGTYLHGILDNGACCEQLLLWAGAKNTATEDLNTLREIQLERLADTAEQHLDFEQLNTFLGLAPDSKP